MFKVEVLYVNGNPAKDKIVHLNMYENGVFKEDKEDKTNEYGRITQIFSTSARARKISFKVCFFDISLFLSVAKDNGKSHTT